MTRINLLPWRERQRKELQRQFASVAAGAAILMGAIILYVHLHMASLIEAQTSRNEFLEKEIALVESKIKEIKTLEDEKQKLLTRMDVIQELQTRRPEIVHLFDEFVRHVPEGVYLTGIEQSGTTIKITGVAQSNATVSSFMRNLDESEWLADPRLEVIEANLKDRIRTSIFTLHVNQTTPIGDADEETLDEEI